MATEPVSETPLAVETPAKRGMTGVEKAVLVGAILVIILVIGVFASLSYSPSRTAPTPPPATPSWHSVATYSGTNDSVVDTVTDTLYINGTQFRIRWHYATDFPQYSVFGFYVYQRGKATPIDIWCQSASSDPNFASCDYSTLTVANGIKTYGAPGYFQVRVLHANVDWTITVEDYY